MKKTELTKQEKHNIKAIIESEMDYLEDVINEQLTNIIEEALPLLKDNQEALVYAREIFFKG